VGGQYLGRFDDLARGRLQQHAIGKGSAGVNSQKQFSVKQHETFSASLGNPKKVETHRNDNDAAGFFHPARPAAQRTKAL